MRMSAKLKRMFGATQVQSAFQLSSQGQDDTEPNPAERDGPALGVAHKEEEHRSRRASENAPPAVVFHEKMAEMANRDQRLLRRF